MVTYKLMKSEMDEITELYDNFIFDLYGTLIDVRTDEHAAATWKKWYRWLDSHGFDHPEYYRFRREFFDMDRAHREIALAAGPYEVPEIDVVPIYAELFEKYRQEAHSRKTRRGKHGHGQDGIKATLEEASYAFRVASRSRFKLFPGVPEFLAELHRRGKHVYILSNAQASYTLPEIKQLGLDGMVDDFIMSSDFGCMKPDRAFFDILLDRHGMDRARSVMIGDSASGDIAGAARAGIASIWLHGDNAAERFYRSRVVT